MRARDEQDRERPGRDVHDPCPVRRDPRGEALEPDSEQDEQRDPRRSEVRPRLADEARRGISGDVLRHLDDLRVDPVAEVGDVVPPEQRADPPEPGQPEEVRLVRRDRRLQRIERPRLDEEEPADRPLERGPAGVGGEVLRGAEHADRDEPDDADQDRHGRRPDRDRAPGQQPGEHEGGQELDDEVAAGQADHEPDEHTDHGPGD